MKIFYEYKSHSMEYADEDWIVLRDENQKESLNDILSPINKQEAMFCTKLYPNDLAIITLRPAARSRKLNDISYNHKDQYFIVITDREEENTLMSQKAYLWEEALAMITIFKSQSFKNAEKIFRIKKL